MNADKRGWVAAILASCLVGLGSLNVQAGDVSFELQNRPVVKLVEKLPEVSEPILKWGFPTSAKIVGEIGFKKRAMIFGGLVFSR